MIHSESEMVKAVKELESGVEAETVAREHGVSRGDTVQQEVEVKRNGCEPDQKAQGVGRGEPQAEADVCRSGTG